METSLADTPKIIEVQDNHITRVSNFSKNALQTPENTALLSENFDKDIHKIIFKDELFIVCPKCEGERTFSKLSNLKRHVKAFHESLYFSLFSSNKYQHRGLAINCDVCNKSFKSIKSMQGHRRKYHKQCTNIKKHKCPLCSKHFERRKFKEHFEKSHNLLLKPVKLKLDCYEKFCEWKKAIERVTKSYFAKQNTRETKGEVHHIFQCHRSGTFKTEGQNKRKLKAQGSKKMNAFCPASMKVIVLTDGKCEVAFQSQHVGHDNELHHLRMTYEERKYIADKLVTNLPLDVILNDIRDSATKCGSDRLSLLTRKDLHNIKSSLLKDKQFYYSEVKLNEELTNNLRDIHNKHAESEQIRADITKIEKGWVLTFIEHNEIYLIKENLKSCDCPLVCIYCKSCVKSYICSCSDSSVEGNMCQHIHFFCMERNKIQDVQNSNGSLVYINDSLDVNDDCLDDTNDFSDHNNDSLGHNDMAENNLEQCCPLQTNNVFSLSELSKTDKPNIIFVDSERKNSLKSKYCDLIDSLTNEEEYKLLESAVEELTVKLKSIQIHSNNRDDTVVPATNQTLETASVNKNVQDKNNSSSVETVQKTLLLQIHNPSKQGSKICYLLYPASKQNNVA